MSHLTRTRRTAFLSAIPAHRVKCPEIAAKVFARVVVCNRQIWNKVSRRDMLRLPDGDYGPVIYQLIPERIGQYRCCEQSVRIGHFEYPPQVILLILGLSGFPYP